MDGSEVVLSIRRMNMPYSPWLQRERQQKNGLNLSIWWFESIDLADDLIFPTSPIEGSLAKKQKERAQRILTKTTGPKILF